MKKNDKKYPSEFFAAQNSYAGFINHFKKTFDLKQKNVPALLSIIKKHLPSSPHTFNNTLLKAKIQTLFKNFYKFCYNAIIFSAVLI